MNYEHPLKYAGILDYDSAQNRAKLMVEENCLKCENFMGQEHDFSNCNFEKPCFVGFKFPSILNSEDFIRFKSKENNKTQNESEGRTNEIYFYE